MKLPFICPVTENCINQNAYSILVQNSNRPTGLDIATALVAILKQELPKKLKEITYLGKQNPIDISDKNISFYIETISKETAWIQVSLENGKNLFSNNDNIYKILIELSPGYKQNSNKFIIDNYLMIENIIQLLKSVRLEYLLIKDIEFNFTDEKNSITVSVTVR